MAAPLTTEQSADLAQYKDLMNYLVPILDKEATIASELRQLTPANITEINDTIALVLINIQAIVTEAGPTP